MRVSSQARTGRELPSEVLDEIVRQIVEIAQPERILLFGSAARGTMGPNSDVDLLVVKAGDYRKLDLAGKIYLEIEDVGEAVDVVVAKPQDLERYGDCFALVYYPALREGREVYRSG